MEGRETGDGRSWWFVEDGNGTENVGAQGLAPFVPFLRKQESRYPVAILSPLEGEIRVRGIIRSA